jgi:hypothetical protein
MCNPHVWVALLALGSPPALGAQGSLEAVLQRLRPGQMVRVRTVQQGRMEGRLFVLQDNTLRLQRRGSPDVPVANIDSLWVQGHALATGAIVGGAAGGLVLGILASRACADTSDCSGVEVPASVGVGLAGGALVGILVGRGVTRWKLRYPKKGFSP